jgi:hypothetical protein
MARNARACAEGIYGRHDPILSVAIQPSVRRRQPVAGFAVVLVGFLGIMLGLLGFGAAQLVSSAPQLGRVVWLGLHLGDPDKPEHCNYGRHCKGPDTPRKVAVYLAKDTFAEHEDVRHRPTQVSEERHHRPNEDEERPGFRG